MRQLRRVPAAAAVVALLVTLLTGLSVSVANRGSVARADVGSGYPYANAVCEFGSSGGSHCTNPSNSSDEYDWGYFTGSTFHPYDPWGYEYRNCTSYVAWRLSNDGVSASLFSGLGNADTWISGVGKAADVNAGVTVDHTATPGSVAVWNSPGVGHVAWVESINPVVVSDYNYAETGVYNPGHALGSTPTGYIHFPGASSGGGSGFNGYESTFQANTGSLYVYGGIDDQNLQQGMAPGTSPSVTVLSNGGYETAFQANTGDLFVYGNGASEDTGQGMMPGTSPSIAASPSGGFRVAFQANNGSLYTFDSSSGTANLQQGMDQASSPAIAAIPAGGYEEAFQANTHNLVVVGNGGNVNTQQGMLPGSSPSIAASSSGGYKVAFEANTGSLYTYTSGSGAANLQQGMDQASSPVIAALSGGGYEEAFQANTHNLIVVGDGGNANTQQGMMPGTSPAIAGSPSGGFQADFQANTGNLYTYTSGSGAANLQQGMMATTSPCVSSSLGGGCAPGLPHYGLSVSIAGTGAGVVSGAGISCPGSCANTFTYGQSIPLTATPSSGSTFTGWSDACSGSGSCSVSINAASDVTATFTKDSVSPPTKGRVVVRLRHDSSPVNGEWVCLAVHKSARIANHRTTAGRCQKTVGGKATLPHMKPGIWHLLSIHNGARRLSHKTVTVKPGTTVRITWDL